MVYGLPADRVRHFEAEMDRALVRASACFCVLFRQGKQNVWTGLEGFVRTVSNRLEKA